LAIMILQIPALGTKDVGDAVEWLVFAVLPNFCFSKALMDLLTKYTYLNACSQIDEHIDRTTFCQLMRSRNTPNPCCQGELQDVISFKFVDRALDNVTLITYLRLLLGRSFVAI